MITVAIGGSRACLDDQAMDLDTPPIETGGRTLVPVRFVAEQMGQAVHWDAATGRVYIGSRKIAFASLDKGEWVEPRPCAGSWHRAAALDYQDFAVVQSERDYLSMPPLQTFAPIAPPQADYGQYIVLWAYLGEARTGGYAVCFDSISVAGRQVTARVRRVSPQPGEIVTQALSYPEAFARVERRLLPPQPVFRFVDLEGKLLKEFGLDGRL